MRRLARSRWAAVSRPIPQVTCSWRALDHRAICRGLKLHLRHILRPEPDGQPQCIYRRHTIGRKHNQHSGRRSAGEIFSVDQPCTRLLGHRFIYLQQFARECLLQFQPFQFEPYRKYPSNFHRHNCDPVANHCCSARCPEHETAIGMYLARVAIRQQSQAGQVSVLAWTILLYAAAGLSACGGGSSGSGGTNNPARRLRRALTRCS